MQHPAAEGRKMASFNDLEFHSDGFISRARLAFPNGYAASVVKGVGTYGADDGLYELAVLHGGRITYETPITSDVVGHVAPEDVTEMLSQIEALPAKVQA
jgi:hypothetical protein